jgi:ABC-type branched-subunit amino acid transport system substrate-binding protein
MKKFFLAAIALLIIFGGCAKKEEDTIRIGTIMPLTGKLSWIGDMYKQQFELIKEKQYKENKIKIEVIYKDSRGEAKNAPTLYQNLKTGVPSDIYFTATTPEGMAIAPQVAKDEDILFAFSSDTKLPKIGKSIFSISISADKQAEVMKGFILKNNFRRISFLYLNSLAMKIEVQSLKNILPKGINVVFEETYEMGPLPVKNQIIKLKKSNSDLLVLFGYGLKFKEIISDIKEQKIRLDILGSTAFGLTPIFEQDRKIFSGIHFANLTLLQDKKFRENIKADCFQKFGYYTILSPHAISVYKVFNLIIPEIFKNRKLLSNDELYKFLVGKKLSAKEGQIYVKEDGIIEFDFFITKFNDDGEILYEEK